MSEDRKEAAREVVFVTTKSLRDLEVDPELRSEENLLVQDGDGFKLVSWG